MEKQRGRRLIGLSLIIVLALSAYLRLSGIGWGLKSGYGNDSALMNSLAFEECYQLIKDRSATTIAVSKRECYFYTAMPAVFPLKSNSVAVELERSLLHRQISL